MYDPDGAKHIALRWGVPATMVADRCRVDILVSWGP